MNVRRIANDELRAYARNEFGHEDALMPLLAAARRHDERTRRFRPFRARRPAVASAHACAVSVRGAVPAEGA